MYERQEDRACRGQRDDTEWFRHTLAFRDWDGVRLDYRPVHLSPLSNEVAPIPPRERVY